MFHSPAKPVTIVGGGLAGLTLGIGLRHEGVPVSVWEAEHYPRHRVCGEFISGRGQGTLERLGLREPIFSAGASLARTAAFVLGRNVGPGRSLREPAWCLSRFVLDGLLASLFCRQGGELYQGNRRSRTDWPEGTVRASGRIACPADRSPHWYGLKVHARGVSLAADLELHGLENGYVGLCRLGDGQTNVCGLFRRRPDAAAPARSWRELLQGEPGSPLRTRLAGAEFDEESFCSVAGIDLRPRRATDRAECCIGDALTMLPPATGNGMSMAFEAAELAVAPLTAWSRGQLSWEAAKQTIARTCDRTFAQRLRWARGLQWLMFAPGSRGLQGRLALGSELVWRMFFDKTR